MLRQATATSSEAYSLVDAGFGYALAPSLYTMPDPFHKILRWRGSPSVRYGLYHRAGARDGLVGRFTGVACETCGRGPATPAPCPRAGDHRKVRERHRRLMPAPYH